MIGLHILVSSHTRSPFLNGINVDLHLSIIHTLAISCAANGSSLFLIKILIFSLIAGNFVFLNEWGMATGESQNISSNGVSCLSACFLLLWVNFKVWSAVGHSSGWEVQ